jgi:hypothetical protein
MRDPPKLTPFPTTGSRTAVASRRRISPLARDIGVVLVVKALVLTALWFAFFRDPTAPGMTMDPLLVEQRVLVPAPAPEPPHAVR